MNHTDSPSSESNTYTVSELTREIKIILESAIPPVWVQGEISNFTAHSSGHMYFSLKDQDAQIACVMWRNRNAALFFTPQDGMKVIALGPVRVYEKRGTYQLDVTKMVPAGIGELQAAFEQLKNRLLQEGLFDESHKKPIPEYPEKIGIVTSPTGAAIRDMIHVINRRYPIARIILRPASVQGEGAALDICDGIDELNAYGDVDVIIVGRGGGSLEDLWAFNEECVARAIYRSVIPVISAVGHEIDFTISDFVADLRAPTPSAAAEVVVPDRYDLIDRLKALYERCWRLTGGVIDYNRRTLQHLLQSYGFRRPADLIAQQRQRIDELLHYTKTVIVHRIDGFKDYISQLILRLDGLHPESILKRGYSVCYTETGSEMIRTAQELHMEENFRVQLYRGEISGKVTGIDTGKTVRRSGEGREGD